jgi:hypothetical protein
MQDDILSGIRVAVEEGLGLFGLADLLGRCGLKADGHQGHGKEECGQEFSHSGGMYVKNVVL